MLFWFIFFFILFCYLAFALLVKGVYEMFRGNGTNTAHPSRTYRSFDPNEYKSRQWKALRYYVIQREHGRCQYCGGKAESAHHVSYREGIICRPELLRAICWPCHRQIHERSKWN